MGREADVMGNNPSQNAPFGQNTDNIDSKGRSNGKGNSDVKDMLHNAGILFLITLLAGLILGFVHELTSEPIRLQEEKAVQEACREVFESADSFETSENQISKTLAESLKENGITIGTIYEAKDGSGSVLGYVVETTSSQGYGGNITLYAGIAMDGTLNGISILEISETPGLGMRADQVLTPQFQNKKVSEFQYTKSGSTSDSEIDAISGATITTKALTNAVNGALKAAQELGVAG